MNKDTENMDLLTLLIEITNKKYIRLYNQLLWQLKLKRHKKISSN